LRIGDVMSAVFAEKSQFASGEMGRVAFNGPIETLTVPSTIRPLDLVHLARQTGGDRNLENEILQLFRQQIGLCATQLRMTSGRERKLIAHTIKGSASAVGAFGLSRIAAEIEVAPSEARLISAAELEVARIRDFIAGLAR
jgi:HPt (histidine-containing phosphotransfer) domain-containing protein